MSEYHKYFNEPSSFLKRQTGALNVDESTRFVRADSTRYKKSQSVSPEVDSQKICHAITSFLSVCFENDNFGDLQATWLAFTKSGFVYFVFHSPTFFEKELFKLIWFISVVKKYVC